MGRHFGRVAIAGALVATATATAVAVVPAQPASALTTIVVNSTLDDPWDGVEGVCQSFPTGGCTLRAALGTAGSVMDGTGSITGEDVIIDLSGVEGLTITTTSELVIPNFPGRFIRLAGSPLPNRRTLVQAAAPTHRVMRYDGTLDGPLTITGLALRGGFAELGSGGGLLATGPVTLRNVEVTGNSATLNGGGVSVEGWTFEIEDSVVAGNSAGDFGGGIYAEGTTVAVRRTEVSDNTTGSNGAGLWLTPRVSSDPLIQDSIFRSNVSSLGAGGAIFCGSCTALVNTLVLDAVSVVDNTGNGAVVTQGEVDGTNLTVAENTGGGLRATGAFLNHATVVANGVGLEATEASFFEVQSSVVVDGCLGDMRVSFPGESVIADSGCAFTGAGTVLPGTTGDLGILAAIGGVRAGSGNALPVAQLESQLDAAPCRATTDARGLARPASLVGCEHGAVESNEAGPTLSLTVTAPLYDSPDAITGDGICADALGACTLRAAVMEAEAFPSNDTIDLSTVSVPISLEPAPSNGTYACPVDVDARCGDLDTTFVRITGNGTDISAAENIFDIRGATTLEGLDLSSATTFSGESGGVVRVAASPGNTVTIRDTRLRNARVVGGDGGGLAITGDGDVVLERVVIDGTQAISGGSGGGIHVGGTATLTASELTVTGAFAEVDGGGVHVVAGATARITNSLLQGNIVLGVGGGLSCECTDVELRAVTIAGNSAANGGAVAYRAAGASSVPPLRLVNVSALDNTTAFGGAVWIEGDASPGVAFEARIEHSTVHANETTNTTDTAGLDVNPNASTGTVTVADSILDGNVESGLESNCAGPIVTEGAVFADPSNCTITSGPPLDPADPQLEPIVDVVVGDASSPFELLAVPVARPAFGSPVVDAATCDPTITTDVVGTPRPLGASCDAGAVEVSGIALRLFPSSAAPTAAGSVVALGDLPPSAVRPRLTAGQLLAPTVDGQTLSATDLQQSPLGSIPLGSIPLGSIPLGSIPLDLAGGWDAVLAGTPLADVPQQNVTFGEVVATVPERIADIPLGALDLSSTPLGSIPLGSIAYATLPLGSIPLGSIGLDWCADVIEPNLVVEPAPSCGPGQDIDPGDPDTTLLAISLLGVPLGSIPLGSIPLGSIPLGSIPLGSIPLGSIDLAASPLGSIPLGSIPLGSIPLGSIPLGSIPLGSIPLGSIPLGSIPLGSIPLGSIPLGSIPLGSIDLATSPLGSIPLGSIPLGSIPLGSIPLGSIPLGSIPLGSIPLGSIPLGSIGQVVDCTLVDCARGTLAEAAAAGALVPGATLGQLGTYGNSVLAELQGADLDDIPLGSIGVYGDATVADLAGLPQLTEILLDELGFGSLADLAGWAELDGALDELTIAELVDLLPQDVRDTLTLGSLLQGVVDPGDYPWEDLDLAAAADELAAANVVTFVVEIEAAVAASTDFELTVELPAGFRYVERSLSYGGVIRSASTPVDDRSVVEAVLEPRNDTTTVTVDAYVPLDVGAVGRAAATLRTTVEGTPLTVTATGTDQVVAEAFEVNDTVAQATPLQPDTLYLTHLASGDDEDWFAVDVARGERLSVILSNLDADYDLTVFGPAASPLRGAPERSIEPAADAGRSLLKAGAAPPVQPLDDLDVTPPAGLALTAVSVNRSVDDERVDTTPLDAGTYYVRVTGYQGASSPRPYALRATLTSPRFGGTCPAIERPEPPSVPTFDTELPAGMTTLLLVDSRRLLATFPQDGASVLAELDEYTSAVNGAPADRFGGERAGVVDLADLAGVQSAYDDWDADPCNPDAANGVVRAIGAALDGVVAQHPTVRHVVLVGNDDQIPHARVRDATVYSNEREYASQIGDAQSPLAAALSLGYLLSDDAYADAAPLQVGPRELFLPELAVGRLVEHPDEITTALDNYVRFDGQLAASTALSTGYDFLDDGADAVADALAANGLGTARLLGDDWTAELLDDALDAAPDVASVNAHFDHFRALPADQNRQGIEENLYTIDDVTDTTGDGLEGSLLFSMGCHAGLSVSDVTVTGARRADWAQTLSGLGATFAGNTGYGYGDDVVIAATEDVMRRFATALDGTLTIGEAMSLAKQQYLASTAVVTPFDEKVVSQVVVYGMPNLRVGDVTPPTPEYVDPPQRDTRTGLDATAISLAGEIGDEFALAETERGDYYTFEGDYLATANQPVQPRAVVDVTTEEGQAARGVLLTGLTSIDVALADPVYTTPAADLGALAPELNASATTFPNALQTVNRYDAPSGTRYQAVIVPGQFTSGGGGRQRLFTSIDAVALYAPAGSTDSTVPGIASVVAVSADDGSLTFRVEVGDDSGLSLVTALFTDAAAPGSWTEVQLVPQPDGSYATTVALTGVSEVDYFVQAVDTAGNVAVSSNKGTYFRSVPVGPPTIELSGQPGPDGWFGEPVTVSVTPFTSGDAVDVTVNGTTATAPITLAADGAYEIEASTPGGPTERTTVRIDTGAPTLSVARTPVADPAAGPVVVRLVAQDEGIGVRSIDFETAGALASSGTILGSSGEVRIASDGTTTLSATAIDGLGRASEPVEVVVTIEPPRDVTAPTVDCTIGTAGWAATNVTVACTATDPSGVDGPPEVTLTTNVAAGAWSTQAFTGTATVCDTLLNCTTIGPFGPFLVDRAAPTLDVRFPLPDAQLTVGDDVVGDVACADEGSGIDECTIGALDTSTPGTRSVTASATDAAGNTASVDVPYRVVAANVAPVVAADFGRGVEDVGVFDDRPRIEGTFDDDGNGPWQVTITWPRAGTTSTATVTSESFAITAPPLGPLALTGVSTVQVCDSAGACGTDTIHVRTKVGTTMSPVLECVVDRGVGQTPRYRARFGYQNKWDFWLYVPVGTDNRFSPTPNDRGQPTLFQPGRQRAVFEVPFSSGNQVWTLSKRTSTASPTSARCAG